VPGGATTNQSATTGSTTAPYAPTQGEIQGILDTIGGVSTAPTAAQTAGTNQLVANASNMPDFSGAATGVANNLLSGGGSNNYAGILNSGYSQLQSELNPIASGSQIGANSALQPELNTIGNDTQNSVQSQFAAAGRSFSPAEAQAIARGTAQGEAPVMAAQYNTDVGNQMNAAGVLNTAAGNTASGLNTLNQTALGNETTGLTAATAIPGILNQNANNEIAAGTAQQNLPYSGVTSLESLLLPIAGLGAQSTGTSTGQTVQQTSPWANILGGTIGAAALLSDKRAKQNIEKVGILNDGQNVYRYEYRADPAKKIHIGLLAQEVEQRNPDAVVEIGGLKHVNYDLATERAAA
jgi:hypothetical protein